MEKFDSYRILEDSRLRRILYKSKTHYWALYREQLTLWKMTSQHDLGKAHSFDSLNDIIKFLEKELGPIKYERFMPV
ncbi:MAG: hypothetical protein ACHQ1D_01540 [Nitrososphaerales archaeon]